MSPVDMMDMAWAYLKRFSRDPRDRRADLLRAPLRRLTQGQEVTMHQLYLSFPSPILQGRAYAAVTIPDGGQAASYGVLYLLHGASGRYTEWLEFTNAARYAADYGFITVMRPPLCPTPQT